MVSTDALATPLHEVPGRNDPLAIASLWLAIGSLIIWFVPALVALAIAPAAKRSIEASEGTRHGSELVHAARFIASASLLLFAVVLLILMDH